MGGFWTFAATRSGDKVAPIPDLPALTPATGRFTRCRDLHRISTSQNPLKSECPCCGAKFSSFATGLFFLDTHLSAEPRKVCGQGQIIRRSPHELRDNVPSLPKRFACVITDTLSHFAKGDSAVAQRKVVLPDGIDGVGLRQTFSDRKRGLVARQRCG